MQITTAGGRGRGRKEVWREHSRYLDRCVREADGQGGDAALVSTCGDEDGEGRREGARRRVGEMWKRCVCVHSSGRDEELLQIQPVLSAAAAG